MQVFPHPFLWADNEGLVPMKNDESAIPGMNRDLSVKYAVLISLPLLFFFICLFPIKRTECSQAYRRGLLLLRYPFWHQTQLQAIECLEVSNIRPFDWDVYRAELPRFTESDPSSFYSNQRLWN